MKDNPDIERLAIVLKHANAQSPFGEVERKEFYRLKQAILEAYGNRDGEDVQHLVKKCSYCRSGWIYTFQRGEMLPSAPCNRCDGKGNYHERWVLLERWSMAGNIFHRPVSTIERRTATIEGLIQHRRTRLALAAQRVLAVLFAPQYYLYLDQFKMGQKDLRRWKAILAYLLGFPRAKWEVKSVTWNEVQEASFIMNRRELAVPF